MVVEDVTPIAALGAVFALLGAGLVGQPKHALSKGGTS